MKVITLLCLLTAITLAQPPNFTPTPPTEDTETDTAPSSNPGSRLPPTPTPTVPTQPIEDEVTTEEESNQPAMPPLPNVV